MPPLELDPAIRCGVTLLGNDRGSVLALAGSAERSGFDSLWAGDHLAFHVPVPESLTLLAVAAGATERIALGTSVFLLPLRPPMVTAKTAATLDALSGGRLVLGIGVGGEFPPEFDAVDVPVGERGSRTDESIGLLRRLWREDDVTHEGRHFAFGPVTLAPKPARPGGPPIWVGGRRTPAFRRAGRLGDGYISHMTSPEGYAENLERMREHAREAGREPRIFGTAAFLFTLLDDRFEPALDRAAKTLGTIYNRPFRDAARKYCLLGRPEDCLEQLRAFARAGARHFILSPLTSPAEFVERAAAELLPAIRGLG